MFWIMMILLMNTIQSLFLVYNFDASLANNDGWIINNGFGSVFTTCNSQNIFGGANSFGVDTSITRFFGNLEAHYEMQIELEFWRIDQWVFDQLRISVDNDVQFQQRYRQLGTSPDYCGIGGYDDQYELLQFKFAHKRKTAWIYIDVSYNADLNQSWGIRTLRLSIEKCPYGCDICSGNDYPQCLRWHFLESFFSQQLILGLEQWDGEGFSISQQQQIQCANCEYKKGMKFHRQIGLNKNLDMRIRILRQNINNIKFYLAGVLHSIIYYQDRLIELEIGGKNQAISQLSLEAIQQELIIRDIEIYFAESENYDTLPFHPGCIQFVGQLCILCDEGWIYIELQQVCEPFCGDRIIQNQEECDDGNSMPFDGCFQCKFQCEENCKICNFGICSMCKEEFQLDDQNICQPICGDSIIMPYSNESCDDGNFIQQDGCFNCKIECQELCLDCYHEICLTCKLGFTLNNGLCVPYCGDGIIMQDEECDDGNLNPFDGCFECKYQCIEGCNICQEGECILRCNQGYMFDIDKCISICGDNIITIDEECDDANLIPFDGCHHCKYSCPLNCRICFSGQCVQCDDQYELIEFQQCQLITQNKYFECDDQNQYPNDGCYNFQIENNFVCQTISQYSECAYSKPPEMILTYLILDANIQYVKIQFNQEVKTASSILLSQTIRTSILKVSPENYHLELQIVYDTSTQIAYVEYILAIEILQLLEEKPILEITLNQKIVNIYEIAANQNSYYLTLKYPTYLNDEQNQYAKMLQKIGKSVLYSLGALGLLSIFLGSSAIFLDILNLLQYYQYLRYINLQFPENLMLFFEISDLISIQPLLDIIHFQDLLNLFSISQSFQKSYEKFEFYGLNADLIQNVQAQIFQLSLVSLLLILSQNQFKKLIYFKIFTLSFYDKISWIYQFNKRLAIQFYQSFYRITKNIFFLKNLLSYHGFRQMFIINAWDLIFKALLFLQSSKVQQIRDFIQIILASLILFGYLQIIISSCKQSQNKQKNLLNLLFQDRFEIYNLLRISYFFTILIFCQKQQIIQNLLISQSSLFSFSIIFYYRNTFKITNLIASLAMEASVFIFTLTSIIYIQDIRNYVGENLRIKFGWFHIIILSIGIILQFGMIAYEKVKNSYNQSKLKQQQQQQQFNSHMIFEEANKRIVIQQ